MHHSDVSSGHGLFFLDIFLFYFCFFFIVLFLNFTFEHPDFFPDLFYAPINNLSNPTEFDFNFEYIDDYYIDLLAWLNELTDVYITTFPEFFEFLFNDIFVFFFFKFFFPYLLHGDYTDIQVPFDTVDFFVANTDVFDF